MEQLSEAAIDTIGTLRHWFVGGHEVELGRTRWLFGRLLGITYLTAFLSLTVQMDGLIGSRGVLPMTEFLGALALRLGPERYRLIPTVLWFSPTDRALHLIAAAGVVSAVLVILGLFAGPALAILWVCYLSLVSVGQIFLAFQWDNLLLEAGFLGLFAAPWLSIWDRPAANEPHPTVILLFRWLLFRLIFSSGVVKLASGDPTWRNLTALTFHYETQPLPTWVGWYVHQLPDWFHMISTTGVFVLELGVPLLFFGPRRFRLIAAGLICGFQVLIMLTGNYTFFNFLTIVLCLWLSDDVWLKDRLPRWIAILDQKVDPGRNRVGRLPLTLYHARSTFLISLAALIFVVSSVQLAATLRLEPPLPPVLTRILNGVAPFRTVNRYGLFAVMTTQRPEIVIEGSRDGQNWQAYEFRWKPGDPRRRPGFVAPHQPRLDWQMWFAALGDYRRNPWVIRLMARLLEGSPDVLRLLASNPFPEEPPEAIRAVVYDYRFTDFRSRRETGNWWRRERMGLYTPEIRLRRP